MIEAGSPASSPFVLKPPSTAYAIGTRIAAATSTRTTYATTPKTVGRPNRTARRPWARAAAGGSAAAVAALSARRAGEGAVHVTAQHEPLVGERHDQAEGEQDDRERAAIAHLRVLEAGLEHRDRHRARGVQRPTGRHDPDHVEELQRSDHRQED